MSRAVPLLMCMIFATCAVAQDGAADVVKTVDETIRIEQQTQAEKDAWATEREQLANRYRTAAANVEFQSAQRDLQQAKVDALNERISEFERRLDESTRLQDSIQDTLDVVMTHLDEWVALDLPFLAEERNERVAGLKLELARPDVTSADKLRRLLEALQIEANYGSTVEVTQQEIELDGAPLFVDILRLGRLSLFWSTPDGKRVGEYDRGAGHWREFDGKHRRAITQAMEMANRMRPTELIALPLGRIAR